MEHTAPERAINGVVMLLREMLDIDGRSGAMQSIEPGTSSPGSRFARP
jgi:hypothetical protein